METTEIVKVETKEFLKEAAEVLGKVRRGENVPSQHKVTVEKIQRPRQDIPSNMILVGDKPFMKYVNSISMLLQIRNESEVQVKSRGKFIGKAVDISQILVNKMLKDKTKIKDVQISTESFKNKEGRDVNVSTICITISKV